MHIPQSQKPLAIPYLHGVDRRRKDLLKLAKKRQGAEYHDYVDRTGTVFNEVERIDVGKIKAVPHEVVVPELLDMF